MRLALSLVLLVGCNADPATPSPAPVEPTPPAVELTSLFPSAVGDRWRERIGDVASRTRGVTARSASGLAVFFGQGDRRPAFYSVSPEEVALTTPDGEVLEPILRAPVRAGARFEYAISGSSCAVDVASTSASVSVRGARLTGCVELTRRCRHPAGVPFPVETTRVSEETYCPRVGRVHVRTSLDPAPSDGEPQSVDLVAFRVAGGPAMEAAERFGCDDALLLPSDVQSALGAGWTWSGEEPARDGCVHRFTRGEAALEVRLSRRADPSAARASSAELLEAHGGDVVTVPGLSARRGERGLLVTATEGSVLLAVQGSAPLDEARVARLFPLLRSLAR